MGLELGYREERYSHSNFEYHIEIFLASIAITSVALFLSPGLSEVVSGLTAVDEVENEPTLASLEELWLSVDTSVVEEVLL